MLGDGDGGHDDGSGDGGDGDDGGDGGDGGHGHGHGSDIGSHGDGDGDGSGHEAVALVQVVKCQWTLRPLRLDGFVRLRIAPRNGRIFAERV